ncbi:MAG: hypothetical protein JWL83_4531 [Actinomycetia bacterium]|nr:hypothetical protein [Actinomycetes bacterium]
MSDDGIFLVDGNDLTVLRPEPYETEAVLQQLLASYPAVLAGRRTGGAAAGLVLVRRELGVPKEEGGSANWSVDHLFLSADAVPVVVEVKRSSDTRIRREVVGQMLDYAANGVRYWPAADLRAAFEATSDSQGVSPDARLASIAPDVEPDAFWAAVEDNLRAGRIRMVFVADKLPAELVRVIEFLNEQMSPAEVLGVEVLQYVSGATKVLVPTIVGDTEDAAAAKGTTTRTPWTREAFLEAAQLRCSSDELSLIEELFAHVDHHGAKLSWGRGVTPGVSGWYPVAGAAQAVWTLNAGAGTANSHAYLSFYFPELHARLPAAEFATFVARLREIPALRPKIDEAAATDFVNRYPSAALAGFGDDTARAALRVAVEHITD